VEKYDPFPKGFELGPPNARATGEVAIGTKTTKKRASSTKNEFLRKLRRTGVVFINEAYYGRIFFPGFCQQ
jgi:hypothetical protein